MQICRDIDLKCKDEIYNFSNRFQSNAAVGKNNPAIKRYFINTIT